MIKSAISNTVYIRLVTTTSIVAKLAVCAVLVAAAVSCAQAATTKPTLRHSSQAKLAKLERDWRRLHSRSQHEALDRLVACGEFDRCEGLQVHPTLGAATAGLRTEPDAPVRIREAAAVNP
ncbi:hypothetical protein [Rhodoplanes sp. Z2-YC6860]|uniref:hypothetical protein n=1 Tax=Rhodoplanes sp. Z2-YC6860 TaxID=674703 RepID=UPI00082E19F1|nr:hypothetical protein [Rhodoplanes sp. Z2-YC6860]